MWPQHWNQLNPYGYMPPWHPGIQSHIPFAQAPAHPAPAPAPYTPTHAHQTQAPAAHTYAPQTYAPAAAAPATASHTPTAQAVHLNNPHGSPAITVRGPPPAAHVPPELPQEDDLATEHTASDQESDGETSENHKGRASIYRSFNRTMGAKYPEHFIDEERDVPYYMNATTQGSLAMFHQPSNIPQLKIDPKITGSWYDPSHKEDVSDTISYWPNGTKFPTLTRVNPVGYKLKAPPRNPYTHIVNEDLRRLLTAPSFTSVSLDHLAFPISSIDLSSNVHSRLDSFLRQSLLDTYTIESYVKLIVELLPPIAGGDLSPEDRMKSMMEVLKLVVLIAEGSQRSGQSQLAAFVTNKLALRDVVLGKFTCQPTSKHILRGSSFLSPNLFGPLPESFKTSLQHNSETNLRLVQKSASTTSTTSTTKTASQPRKRPANFRSYINPKRRRGYGKKKNTGFNKPFFRSPGNKKS